LALAALALVVFGAYDSYPCHASRFIETKDVDNRFVGTIRVMIGEKLFYPSD